MVAPLFCPSFEQRRNGPAIIRDQSELLTGGLLQASCIVLAEKCSILPFLHGMHDEGGISAPQPMGNGRRNMLIE